MCDYDGGDCCWDVNSDMCTECVCHCQNVHLVANGICNDEANTFECNYDGGDCCVNVCDHFGGECHTLRISSMSKC